jgi:hypothetical protein
MKDLLSPWVIAGSVILAGLLLTGLFWLSGFIAAAGSPEYSGEAALTIIPNPTATPTLIPTSPPLAATPTDGGLIQAGGYVKITGTEGSGLRLRDQPSLNGNIKFLGMEDEIFLVINGPEDRDGYLWWYLQAPANEARQGWAAANVLIAAQGQ